jgi:hypothetical protein
MPMASTFAEFIAARNTGRTNTVEVLETIFNTITESFEHWDWFNQIRALDVPIPPNVRTFLLGEGMSDGEIDHLDDWPAAQKERARRKLAANAVKGGERREVVLAWRVAFHGDAEAMEIDDPDENGKLVLAAITPWSHIRVSADGTRVTVDTGG